MKTVKPFPSHILNKKKFVKYRLVKVKTFIPPLTVKEIISCNSLNSELSASTVIRHIDNKGIELLRKYDDNINDVHCQLISLRSYVEKCFLLVFFVLFIILLISLF